MNKYANTEGTYRGARPAESLIEVIAAITVIVFGVMGANSMVRLSLGTNEVFGEKVVAMNLAESGLAAVQNIRDTNYLNFATDPDECWNTLNATSVSDCATSNKIKASTTYYLTMNLDSSSAPFMKWSLSEYTEGDSETDGSLSLYSYETADGTKTTLYAQSGATVDTEFTKLDETTYDRTLYMTYPDDNTLNVLVTVEWEIRGEPKSISVGGTVENIY